MKSKYWIKLYHEMLDDPKVARLNDSAYRLFIECLLLAGEINEDGLLPPVEDMAWRLHKSEVGLPDDMTHLALAGLVEIVQHETGDRWLVTKFSERQAPSPAAQRMAKYRERKRKEAKEKERKIDEDTDIDTYTYRTVTPVTNRNEHVTHIYDGHEENDIHHLQGVAAEIATVTKTAYGPGINEDKFQQAAQYIISLDAVDRIPGFAKWWKENGYYSGKPALKSFIDEFQNYLDGATLTNGNNVSQKQGPAAAALDEYETIRSQFHDAIS